MATIPAPLTDIRADERSRRLRLLAPLRYLAIYHAEKTFYDFALPAILTVVVFLIYLALTPRPPIFGDEGLIRYVRDMLMMAVPFMIGALAAVAMGAPGDYFDKRPNGVELLLSGRALSLRQFTCYLLGYLSFLGMVTLGLAVVAGLVKPAILAYFSPNASAVEIIRLVGVFALSCLLSTLSVTVFWALYFLTDVVNHPSENR